MLPLYIVIVDSDPRFLEIASQFLQKRGDTLVYSAATTNNDILRHTSVFKPDIVLYNLDESDPTSLATIKTLRSRFPELTIVVISQSSNKNFEQSAIEAGDGNIVLRHAMNLESLPAIWSLISMYKQRNNRSDLGTIPARHDPILVPHAPKVQETRRLIQ